MHAGAGSCSDQHMGMLQQEECSTWTQYHQGVPAPSSAAFSRVSSALCARGLNRVLPWSPSLEPGRLGQP